MTWCAASDPGQPRARTSRAAVVHRGAVRQPWRRTSCPIGGPRHSSAMASLRQHRRRSAAPQIPDCFDSARRTAITPWRAFEIGLALVRRLHPAIMDPLQALRHGRVDPSSRVEVGVIGMGRIGTASPTCTPPWVPGSGPTTRSWSTLRGQPLEQILIECDIMSLPRAPLQRSRADLGRRAGADDSRYRIINVSPAAFVDEVWLRGRSVVAVPAPGSTPSGRACAVRPPAAAGAMWCSLRAASTWRSNTLQWSAAEPRHGPGAARLRPASRL